MEKFFRGKVGKMRSFCPGRKISFRIFLCLFLLLAVTSVFRPSFAFAEKDAGIAILPVRFHAPEKEVSLRKDIQEMLALRIEKKGMEVLGLEEINRHPLAFSQVSSDKELILFGKDVGATWVILGSLTQIGERLSLDLKVVDVSGKRKPFFLFMAAENMDALEETSSRIATSVYNEISGVEQIETIIVKGNKRIEKDAILEVISSRKGDSIDYDLLDEDLREVYSMGFFKNVSIDTEDGSKGKIVIFNVSEKPSIGQIVFKGNKKIKDKDLKEEVGIKLYSILDRNKVRQSISRLKELYHKKAYYNVDIKEKTEELPNNEVLIAYEIDEKKKVYIRKIRFEGNEHFDDDDLSDIMVSKEKGFFSWITSSGLLDKKALEFDVHMITSFYNNQGFIRAKIGEPEITYEEGEGLMITIAVQEGAQYTVGEVMIKGDFDQAEEELLGKVRIGSEKYFNRKVIREDTLALKSVFLDEGHANAEVSPSTKEDDEGHRVDITYNISKGPLVKFERINITGNTSTRDKVIRRELKAIEGRYFSGAAFKKSTENLNRLGFFEDVELKTKKGSAEDLMILDVKVKERPTGSFSMGAGYSSQDSAFVMFEIGENNFLGKGQKLSAYAKVGGESSYYDIKFVEPWIFDRNISGGVDLYKWEYEYDDYTRDATGASLSLGFPIPMDEYTRGSIKYGYDSSKISDVENSASLIIRNMEGRTNTSSTTFEIKRDSRDRPWNTSRGSVNSISFEYAGGILSGDEYFNKYDIKSAWYWPFYWDTVFMTQARWGYVKKRSGGSLSPFQKYFLGGINTVRGFDYAEISPKDNGEKIGGEKMMVFNLEYVFPLLKEQGVNGVIFSDFGNSFRNTESLSFSDIKKSAGIGFRWYSPMGPLRLEYGKNLDPEEGESSGKYEFSVGGFF